MNDPAWLNLTVATVEKDITRSENASGYDNLTNRFKTSQDLLNRLIDKLGNNRLYREHYQDFVEDFTYGRSLSFDEAVASLSDLIRRLIK